MHAVAFRIGQARRPNTCNRIATQQIRCCPWTSGLGERACASNLEGCLSDGWISGSEECLSVGYDSPDKMF
jgi:hypothetical protein